MIKIASSLCLASLFVLGLQVAPAHATSPRTFVSGTGANNPTCDRANPCQGFQAAHDATSAGGVIVVLDACGTCGALTITKAISIIDDGVPAGMLVSGGLVGITINASANDNITLRGLTIAGIDNVAGATGIRFNSGKSLTIKNCAVHNVAGSGIVFAPAANGTLMVSNTLVTGSGGDGIVVAPTGTASVTGIINRSELISNGFAGLDLIGQGTTGTIKVTVNDSVAANNGTPGNGAGFLVQSATGKAFTVALLFRSVAANNPSNGVVAFGPGAYVDVAESAIMTNASGWLPASGGAIYTYGNNVVLDNTTNGGAMNPLSAQ